MVIINSIISPSHAGEFEDDGENDSACDKESEVINCDVEQNMKYVERLFFHGRSPLCIVSFRIGISVIPCHPISVFELNISHNTAI